jgi:hypothetical protein
MVAWTNNFRSGPGSQGLGGQRDTPLLNRFNGRYCADFCCLAQGQNCPKGGFRSAALFSGKEPFQGKVFLRLSKKNAHTCS